LTKPAPVRYPSFSISLYSVSVKQRTSYEHHYLPDRRSGQPAGC
jgi:hypothetical protein